MKSNNIFEFRGECSADAQAIRAVLLPWLMDWREVRSNLDYEGEKYAITDVSVVFSLTAEGPSLNEMLWLFDAIDNCHIAAETLSRVEDFTGERQKRKRFEFPAQRPSDDILQQVNAAVSTHQHFLSLELNRYGDLSRTYGTACRLGEKWNPPFSKGSRPAWMIVTEHLPTGLKSLRRVSPPIGLIARKALEKLGDTIINSRIFTIAA